MADTTYTGWKKWNPTSEEWINLYTNNIVPFQLKENEYLIVKTDDRASTFYCWENNQLRKFTGGSIKTVKDTTPVPLEQPKQQKQ